MTVRLLARPAAEHPALVAVREALAGNRDPPRRLTRHASYLRASWVGSPEKMEATVVAAGGAASLR